MLMDSADSPSSMGAHEHDSSTTIILLVAEVESMVVRKEDGLVHELKV